MQRLTAIVASAAKHAASDAIIRGNTPVVLRINGTLYAQKQVVYTPQEIDALLEKLLTSEQKKLLRHKRALDLSAPIANVYTRINICSTANALVLSLRFLPTRVPTLESLNLHPSLKELCKKKEGLILVCGTTGSGKTTTIAALLDHINSTRAAHIVTVEDPIEFRHINKVSIVDQRELGTHFHSYEEAMVDAMRQLPDVIMVGELRTKEEIANTVNIAESGHLVISTMHARNPEAAIFRLLNAYPPEVQEFACIQLSSVLEAVIVQRLTKHPKVDFLVPQLSILRMNSAVRNTIREHKINQISSFLEVGREENMFTFHAYKEDYLDKKQSFAPPAMLYQSSGNSRAMKFLTSRLVDYGDERPSSPPQFAEPHSPARKTAPPPQEVPDNADMEGIYSVNDVVDYDDIINNLTKSNK